MTSTSHRIWKWITLQLIPSAAAHAHEHGVWREATFMVDEMLTRQSWLRRMQFQYFLLFVAVGSLLCISPRARERWLRSLENSPALILRRGFWGLRTLIYLGYYGQPAIAAGIGYRPNSRGWETQA